MLRPEAPSWSVPGFWICAQNRVSTVGSFIEALRAGRYDKRHTGWSGKKP
jgi:hypothetical protein